MKRYVWPHPPVQPPMPRKNWWDEAISPSARREPTLHRIHYFDEGVCVNCGVRAL